MENYKEPIEVPEKVVWVDDQLILWSSDSRQNLGMGYLQISRHVVPEYREDKGFSWPTNRGFSVEYVLGLESASAYPSTFFLGAWPTKAIAQVRGVQAFAEWLDEQKAIVAALI